MELIQPAIFLFLPKNVGANHRFVSTDGRDEVAPCPQVLPGKIASALPLAELQVEIETLKRLEAQAKALRQSGVDAKWVQLDSILDHP